MTKHQIGVQDQYWLADSNWWTLFSCKLFTFSCPSSFLNLFKKKEKKIWSFNNVVRHHLRTCVSCLEELIFPALRDGSSCDVPCERRDRFGSKSRLIRLRRFLLAEDVYRDETETGRRHLCVLTHVSDQRANRSKRTGQNPKCLTWRYQTKFRNARTRT